MSSHPDRLHGLDAVRAAALLLGIVLHAAMSYLPGAQYFWIVSDADSSVVASVLFHTIHLFRMTLFFVLAGFFGRWLLLRRGSAGFVRDRGKRIGLPLLMFWGPSLGAIVAVLVWSAWLANGGALPTEPPPRGPAFTWDDFPLTHLWFLYVLLWMYAVALLLHQLVARLDRNGSGMRAVDALARRVAGPGAALLLAVPVATALWAQPDWMPWFGIPTPDRALLPNRPALIGYGVAFAAGWLLQRQPSLLIDHIARRWPLHLGLALGASTCLLVTLGPAPAFVLAGGDLRAAELALLVGVGGWAWTLAAIGIGLRLCTRPNRVVRYVADASYWMYIAHLPLVMALQVAASRVDAPWWIELPALVAIAVALLLASYALCVRTTWLGEMLGGRRVARLPAQMPGHVIPRSR